MPLEELRNAFASRSLTLYLGAGVSMPSGLPSWDRLVLTMYLAALGSLEGDDNPLRRWRVFPNYLEAIAEWLLGKSIDPAEITAQKIRSMVDRDDDFVSLLKETLYKPIQELDEPKPNPTLDAVIALCQQGDEARGVRMVVTYNFDDLLEQRVDRCKPVWEDKEREVALAPGDVPVYHAHGYLAQDGPASPYENLVLTEEQFHAAASDPYSWSNLVQMRQLGSNVGLMVGMSLRDRNLRRILEAMRKLTGMCKQYAILQRESRDLEDTDVNEIVRMAQEYGDRRKSEGLERDQIRRIFGKLDRFDQERTECVLGRLGVEVIWVDDFDAIPGKLAEIR